MRGASKTSDAAISPKMQATPTTKPESTSSAETKDWKIFQSKEYNFEIKYPSNVSDEEKYINPDPKIYHNSSHVYFTVDGGILEIYGACGRGIQIIKRQDIIIGGQKTVKFYETENSGAIAAIPRPNSNEYICFNFKLPTDPQKTKVIDQLFDQILSTFKFTQ